MSAGLTASSSLAQGVSQYEAGQARSKLYQQNAGIATMQANSEAEAGAYNANAIRMKGAALEGQQVAQIGGNNLQQVGTPAQVIASSRMVNEMDALQTQNNAMRRAWGFKVQAASDEYQSKLDQKAAYTEGFGTILGGGAKAYDQKQKTGVWF